MLEKMTDPVCGMSINPYEALAQTTYQGQLYVFCSQECRNKFDRQPAKYVERQPDARPEH